MAVATMSATDVAALLQEASDLHILQAREETFSTGNASPNKRVSDASFASDPLEDATPASLDADLAHYKDLFTKLKFSYLEQVTKEKFLRAITASPPVFIDVAQSSELEGQIAEDKAALKAQKLELDALLAELQDKGTDLAHRCSALAQQREELAGLPREITAMEREVAALREAEALDERHSASDDPHMQLNLGQTVALVEQREAQFNAMEEEVEALRAILPAKVGEVERLEREMKPLEVQKLGAIAAAREARERMESRGGGLDGLEARGRWLDAAATGLSLWLPSES